MSITPALLMSRSTGGKRARISSAALRTLDWDARSRRTTDALAPADAAAIWSAARPALSAFRQARTTWAPRPASTRAACRPSPVLAPVTTAVFPARSGMSASVQCR